MRKKITMLVTAVVLSLVMMACGTAQTSNNVTSTPESTKEVEATTAPEATNTPTAEPIAEPTAEPVATDAPTPEATAMPEATATPEPVATSTPVPTEEPIEEVKSFPCTVTYMQRDIYENPEDYYEVQKTFNSFVDLMDFIEIAPAKSWSYSDIEALVTAIDSSYVELKEVKPDVDKDFKDTCFASASLSRVYDDDGNKVATVPVEWYEMTIVERTTGDSFVWAYKFILEDVANPGTYYDKKYDVEYFAANIYNGSKVTPEPTATPVPEPTKAPEPTKTPVVVSKDFETVLNELFVLFTYDERADYIAKLDKSAYKVGTIDSKKFFGTDLNRWFTDEMIDFGGERHAGGYRTGKNIKYVTLEDLSTGEVHVWGVEFEVKVGDSIKTDVLIMENVVLEYNYNYATESGAVLDWPTLKYYIDVFNPADYLE